MRTNIINQNNTFTIIIPFMNMSGEEVLTCLNSLKNQTSKNFKVIFINNNSKRTKIEDFIKEVIKDSFVYSILHEPNPGVCKARNKGLSKLLSGWVLFLDIDDAISENYIHELNMMPLDQYAIYKPYYSYKMEGKEFLQTSETILKKSFDVGFSFFWRKESMKLFDENLTFNETLDFILSNNLHQLQIIFIDAIYHYYLQPKKKYEDTKEYLKKKHKNIKLIKAL
ncbi:glycosyltransferase family A protein [Mycoplasma todarodis]|uniref:Glycosyltransferase 2-like domain-containing protein n=1 Tax=Mycoplasma todarodis TaxID=1937191 RepID=A0A4R0XYG3_9MOLU|nr:glycosyltransferase family A protein [Mycoplasma todarodis]TCG12109.1 hypothetical protein C4B25_00240 [Mycoplasma todarodis]